ncbi:hypothetical protein BC830DRAFT_1215742 [Chytriomyces sp. MP71]|nr:hypothetical protein BC830DRAFT_1215742 [Chytriomyces sp. MP71]
MEVARRQNTRRRKTILSSATFNLKHLCAQNKTRRGTKLEGKIAEEACKERDEITLITKSDLVEKQSCFGPKRRQTRQKLKKIWSRMIEGIREPSVMVLALKQKSLLPVVLPSCEVLAPSSLVSAANMSLANNVTLLENVNVAASIREGRILLINRQGANPTILELAKEIPAITKRTLQAVFMTAKEVEAKLEELKEEERYVLEVY